ncbi:hypothetical protein CCHL11_03897 [Colletotrichum chlorophyti]|uniref:Uncharacterized protein n=1 Tax=Colletotrichum chlorophyti TaxID=708187 RepID=A0A1Q8RLC0_9PEZI|nr:hypothetical protein CCHL11_03897 [Colletotrichum chlorophyti]
MKGRHIALPGLQGVAMALLAARGAQAKVFCADKNNVVVADTDCDGKAPVNTFFMFNSEAEHAVGSVIDDAEIDKHDSTDVVDRQNARFPPDIYFVELEARSGGFGKRKGKGKRECSDGRTGGG